MTELNTIDELQTLHRTSSLENKPNGHHHIVLSYLYGWMEEVAPLYVKGRLLDFGCGGQTYRSLLEPQAEEYVGADVAAAPGVSLDLKIVPGQQMDAPDDSFDSILSNQVLEHVPDPDFYLSEAARVLKPGGTLILTAPMQWRHHEVPFDYYRYTKYGLTELLGKNGFKIERLDTLGGAIALTGQIFLSFLSERRKVYNGLLYRIINSLCLRMDRKYYDPEDTLGWLCIATKTVAVESEK